MGSGSQLVGKLGLYARRLTDRHAAKSPGGRSRRIGLKHLLEKCEAVLATCSNLLILNGSYSIA